MKNTVENFQVKNNKEMQMEAKLRAHCYELEGIVYIYVFNQVTPVFDAVTKYVNGHALHS